MDYIYALLLGTVQGLTEFLPVSSTGHLILFEKYLNLSPLKFGLSFDIALHLGTLFALVLYFKSKLKSFITNVIKGKWNELYLIILGTVPALLVGFLLEKYIRNNFRSISFIAANLILFSFVFLAAEKYGKRNKKLDSIGKLDAFIIGCFQSLALLPGVSRSGITISGGLVRNLKEEHAGEFAFFLSIPIVLIASLKDIYDGITEGLLVNNLSIFAVGALTSFIVGFICIKYFLKYLKKHGLSAFILYRIILGIGIFNLFK